MATPFSTNLPLQLTSFIGRGREIADVRRLLGTTRLLTLTGSGGCGKTRLAIKVASDLRDGTFPDGVWLVDLAPLSDSSLVPQTVASVFDLHESGNSSITDILKNYLRTKKLLLVLDNCEHLIQACAHLCNEMLHAAPDLKILATSREAMNIAGETAFRVPSLSLPDPQQLPPLKSFSQYEALRLFIERAQAARPEFELQNANASAIAQICRRLDGMPLAIELAAARVNAFPVEEIAARLDDCFRLLTSGSRTALPRYQTLRASLDWSYDLLSDVERELLRRLAVFAGGFTLKAVESVCGEEHKDEVFETLSQLIQKSLVVAKLDDQPGYRLLETIRQYAFDKLLDSGEAEHVRALHLDFFLKFAEDARPKLYSAEQLMLLNRQGGDYENLRVAIQWACEDPSRFSNSPETGLRIMSALEQLGEVYRLLGVGTQAITFYQKAVALGNRLANADQLIMLRLHGKIVETASSLMWSVDLPRFEAANQIGIASLAILRTELNLENLIPHPDIVHLLTILSRAAWINQVSPDWSAAERNACAAVDMAEKLDAPLELSNALRVLDNVYFARGLLRERVQVALQQLALADDPRFSDMRRRVDVLTDASHALETVGEYALALTYIKQAATLDEQIQGVNLWRSGLSHSAYCFFRMDRWDEVLEVLDQVRDIRNRYPRERAGPECFAISLAASVHARRGELVLSAAGRTEAQGIMTTTTGPMDHWGRAQIH
jgi:predicted ATPase